VDYVVDPSSAEYFQTTQSVQVVNLYFPAKNAVQFPPSGPVETALQEQQAEKEVLHGRFAQLSALTEEVNLEKPTLSLLSNYGVDELGQDNKSGSGGADISLAVLHTHVLHPDRRQNINCDSSNAQNPSCSHVGYSTSICSDPPLPSECPASSSELSKELLRVMLGIVQFDATEDGESRRQARREERETAGGA
jgi:hypothetical protein